MTKPEITTEYHCSCGESYTTRYYAIRCRKCVQYLSVQDYHWRTVVEVMLDRDGQAFPFGLCPKWSRKTYPNLEW